MNRVVLLSPGGLALLEMDLDSYEPPRIDDAPVGCTIVELATQALLWERVEVGGLASWAFRRVMPETLSSGDLSAECPIEEM